MTEKNPPKRRDKYSYVSGVRPGDQVKRADDPFGLAPCLHWTVDEVGDWLESVGFEKYKGNFRSHFIDGRRLIDINSTFLPRIGIKKFDDVLALTRLIRDQLYIKPNVRDWNKFAPRKGYISTPHLTGNERTAVNFRRLVLDSDKILTARERCLSKSGFYYSGWSMVPGWKKVAKCAPIAHLRGKTEVKRVPLDPSVNTTDYNLAPLLRKAALSNITLQLPNKKKAKGRKVLASSSSTEKRKTLITGNDGRPLGVIDLNTGMVTFLNEQHIHSSDRGVTNSTVNSLGQSAHSATGTSHETRDGEELAGVFHGGVYLPVVFHWSKMQESRGYPKLKIKSQDPCLYEDP